MYYSQFKLIFHLENRVFYLQVIRNEVNSYGGMRNKNIEASNQDTHGASPGHRKATLSTKINDKIKILSIIIACTSSILNGEVLQTTHTGPCCCFDLLWQFPPQFASEGFALPCASSSNGGLLTRENFALAVIRTRETEEALLTLVRKCAMWSESTGFSPGRSRR
jgi:hypothetical protein